MIKIEYCYPTPDYDAYINQFAQWLNRQLSNNRWSIINKTGNNPDTVSFVNWLLTDDNLNKICHASADDLKNHISYIENAYPILKNSRIHRASQGQIYDDLISLFVNHGYAGFQMDGVKYGLNKDELHDAIGVEVCPYCNRIYIKKQASKDGSKVVKGELDHFYAKELFPYLAIAKHNLVPCCSFCNGQGGKYTADAYKEGMQNPYGIIDNDKDFSFTLKIKNNNVVNMQLASKGLAIHMVSTTSQMKKNIDVLNLEPLYSQHIDHAAELLLKSRINDTKPYRSFLKKRFKDNGITLTDDEIDRILIGNYPLSEDYGKRPLAKLYHDIAKELGLIK